MFSLKNLFKKQEPKKNNTLSEISKVSTNYINDLYSSVAITDQSLKSSLVLLYQRREMSTDPFVRQIVSLIINRAIGTTEQKEESLVLSVKDRNNILSDSIKRKLQEEFYQCKKVIAPILKQVLLDSAFYGRGYAKPVVDNTGIKKIVVSILSLKPYHITPYKDNINDEIKGFEVTNSQFHKAGNKGFNGKNIIKPQDIVYCEMNDSSHIEITSDDYLHIESMNTFSDIQSLYPAPILGGLVQNAFESYENYKKIISSLLALRINSVVLERFMMQSVQNTNPKEREAMAETLKNSVKKVQNKIKDKIDRKDPLIHRITHIVPHNELAGGLQIQESQPDFSALQNMDDVTFAIKILCSELGYDYSLTAFSDGKIGGYENEGTIESSIIMESKAEIIRETAIQFVEQVIQSHFRAKFKKELNLNFLDVSFPSVITNANNKAEMFKEGQKASVRLTTELIEGFIGLGLSDNETSRRFIRSQLDGLIFANQDNKEQILDDIIDIILSKQKEEENDE